MTTKRRILVGAAEICIATALVLEAAALWFAITAFPHACCAALAGLALAARAWLRPLERPALQWRAKWYGLAVGVFGLLTVVDECVRHGFRDDEQLQSCYLSTSASGRLLRVANVVPEADLFSLGVKASGLLGIWPRDQMPEVRAIGRKHYARMAMAEGFAHAGNVATVSAYPGANRHYFRYLPRGYGPERKWPLMVFLHGAAGNQALYPWLWSTFADEQGFVVICPTWDEGEWEREEGTRLALDALDDTLAACSIDEQRVFLAGCSNGAMGGWAVLAARPEAFRGFVSISGGALARWRDERLAKTPVLLLHGSADRAVPASASRELAKQMILARRPVQLFEMAGEDHFLILRSTGSMLAVVAEWVRRVEGGEAPAPRWRRR